MTKKDYELIAKAIRESAREPIVAGREQCGINIVAQKIATALRETNPRFDSDRFLEACGVPEGERNQ